MLDVSPALKRRQELKASRLERYRRLLEIRMLEDRVLELYVEGHIAGSTHTCQGQEAVSVGIAAAARATDPVMCTYRSHGAALALGATPQEVLGEILNKTVGGVRGLGGSMHLCNLEVGLFPTFAIVGAGIPVAVGAAFAAQVQDTDDVAIAIFGDGATNIGAFHEGLNLAAIWQLPVIFICENNLYGEYTRYDRTTPIQDLASRAESYAMEGVIVDGQDVDAVEASVAQALDKARQGRGPTFIEMKTYRFVGHSRGDAGTYRPDGELEKWQTRDPLELFGSRLIEEGIVDSASLLQIRHELEGELERVVDRVIEAPRPETSMMFEHILAPGPPDG